MSFPGRLKPTYRATLYTLLDTVESRIRLLRAQKQPYTDREGRKLSLETPLDRSFPLPLTSSSTPFPLLSSHRYILPVSPLSSLTVPSSSSRSLCLSRSFCLLLLFLLDPLAARSCSFSTVVRVLSFSRVYVGKQGARYFRPSPTRNAVPGGVFRHTAMDGGGNDEPSPALPRRSFTPRNVAREENRELWHNFRRRRRRGERAPLLLATSADLVDPEIVSHHSSVCVNNRNFPAR